MPVHPGLLMHAAPRCAIVEIAVAVDIDVVDEHRVTGHVKFFLHVWLQGTEVAGEIDELLRTIDGGSMLALRRPPNCYINDNNNGKITVK